MGNVEFLESPVSFADAQNLAKSKGGRLLTSQEAKLVLAHRAAAENKSVDSDIDTAKCFATTDDSHTTFHCEIVKTPTLSIVSGEACAEVPSCSLFMWTVPKEEEEQSTEVETMENKAMTESITAKPA